MKKRKLTSSKVQRTYVLLAVCGALAAEPISAEVVLSDGVTVSQEPPEFIPQEANQGAFEGGPSGTKTDAAINLAVPENMQRSGGSFNIPTGAAPSPLFGAPGFTQKLLRLEEFGTEKLPVKEDIVKGGSFPRPAHYQSGPNNIALTTFLNQDINPYPTRLSNVIDRNPWQPDIESFLGRSLDNPPAEGRAPGELWSHQRWDEFYPETYFQTAQATATVNSGWRDDRQRHKYAVGEFAPGGLYHNTSGSPGTEGTTEGISVNFDEGYMPNQLPLSLFTFDGTFPPKLLQVRYGEGVLFRHYNALPIDPSANNGFGIHTLTTHEHNGHTPAESDGYTQAFFFPGQFYDYRWPIQLAGYDSINTSATDPRAGRPDGKGGITNIRGDYRETMSTHWFHDHMLDFTAQNVYKGNVAMMNYYSSIDRGNETIDDGVNLRFPSGTALDWGNRDYDINLVLADKAWDNQGQLFFNIFNTDGFLGDRILTNWVYNPYFEVRARRYRFRWLNGSVSRYFKIAFVTESGEPVPFHMILNDGNIMQHAVAFPNATLPTLGIAERYDIIIDFSKYEPGTKIYAVNLLEHKTGRGPEKDPILLDDVLSGAYKPVVADGQWQGGDPGVGKFLEFQVVAYDGVDLSLNPIDYEPGKKKMVDLPEFSVQDLANARHRSFEFGRSNGTDGKPWTIKTDGGQGFGMDPRRLSAAPVKNGDNEIWHILNGGGGWSHPVHIHFEEGKVLSRDGKTPPEWEIYARKDVYRIGPEIDSSQQVSVALRFREFAGTYMEHCHNTQHEDTSMLLRWDIENPGQVIVLPTPLPTWDGVTFVDSHALPTFRTGDAEATADGFAKPADTPVNGTDPVVAVTDPVPAVTDPVAAVTDVEEPAVTPVIITTDNTEGFVKAIDATDLNADGTVERVFNDQELRGAAHVALSPGALELSRVPDMQHILDDYVDDKNMIIALGKAFFWDQSAGSDNQACASCHFAAGADTRSKNQLSPGLLNRTENVDPQLFDITNSGGGGPNYQLVEDDFPFPKKGLNGLLFDDVVSSQGIVETVLVTDASQFDHEEQRFASQQGKDLCETLPSEFSVAGLLHRKVEPRNTPTVINAVFNLRNFWDGRANNMFNGVDSLGRRSNVNNPEQGIWVYDRQSRKLSKEQVLIKNSSLASQALSPAISDFEMACKGKTFPLLGRILLERRALQNQRVASDDSVLGPLVHRGNGLKYRYNRMIRKAFKRKYWGAPGKVDGEFTQMEANFALFWGLAIQMYEATLVSHMTPYDLYVRGDNNALTEQQKLGLEVFVRADRGNCAECHAGSEFTSATVKRRSIAPRQIFDQLPFREFEPPEATERMRMADGGISVYDGGFYNLGVTPSDQDLCIGADLAGFPLSFARQASTGNLIDAEAGATTATIDQTGHQSIELDERDSVKGACKTPTLRNVALTAPYFHNGGHSTLEQVVTSYMLRFTHLFADENTDNVSPEIPRINIHGSELDALVAFMNGLTDERVRWQQAPFDHPGLEIPNGSSLKDGNKDGIADDDIILIPAVGAGGLDAPLSTFLNLADSNVGRHSSMLSDDINQVSNVAEENTSIIEPGSDIVPLTDSDQDQALQTFTVTADLRGRIRFGANCPSGTQQVTSSEPRVTCSLRRRATLDGRAFHCRGNRLDPGLEVTISCGND